MLSSRLPRVPRSDSQSVQVTPRDIFNGARFVASLHRVLRHPLDPVQARAILKHRLEHRADDFLVVVRQRAYGYTDGIYAQLLSLAGCEYGDVEQLVHTEGIEGALHCLYRQGVYLTVDELKGRKPVVRGSATFEVHRDSLSYRGAAVSMETRSSGSRGAPMVVPLDVETQRDKSVNTCVATEARGALHWPRAVWSMSVGSIIIVLRQSGFGDPPVRWFLHSVPDGSSIPTSARWGTRAIRLASYLAGRPIPGPIEVALEDPLPIAQWMASVLRTGRVPHLCFAFSSSALRVCQTAEAHGLDLQGAQFTICGEPITEARLAAIRRVGANALPEYGTNEAGIIGYGCVAPDVSDDHHLYTDLFAAIQPGEQYARPDLPSRAVMLSSIRKTAALMLINVSMGDEADLSKRDCGCLMQQAGWLTHISSIRSYEKLTAGGMTFLDTDIVRILEHDLPARFGGGALDYQLVESEDVDGKPLIRLLVSPSVGTLDPNAVRNVFLSAIGEGSAVERVMAEQWRTTGLPVVERQPPVTTSRGKIVHLHRLS
jgi:hypothetical protein